MSIRRTFSFTILLATASALTSCSEPGATGPTDEVRPRTGPLASVTTPPFWHLDRINQTNLPLDSDLYALGSKGRHVQIFIIDTGIRMSHSELEDNTVFGAQFGSPSGSFHHGTAVASLAGGAELSNSWSATIINVVAGETVADTKAALLWVANNATRPAVINLSRGFSTNSSHCNFSSGCLGLTSLIEDIILEADIPIVAAAGNDGENGCHLVPAGVQSVITVAASDVNDEAWDDSNGGSCVDLFAPGVTVRAADSDHDVDYRNVTGTSFAAPIVTGVIARYLSTHPTATPSQVGSWLLGQATNGVLVGTQGSGPLIAGTPDRLLFNPDYP